jgi:RecA/RadA recombinase
MDNGCLCNFCSKKRKEIIDKLKKGDKIENEKINHNVDLIKKEMIENSMMKSKQQQQNNTKSQHNRKIKNTLNSIVFTSPF